MSLVDDARANGVSEQDVAIIKTLGWVGYLLAAILAVVTGIIILAAIGVISA